MNYFKTFQSHKKIFFPYFTYDFTEDTTTSLHVKSILKYFYNLFQMLGSIFALLKHYKSNLISSLILLKVNDELLKRVTSQVCAPF